VEENSESTRNLYIKAALGNTAHEFFNSDLGQYLIEKSLKTIADNQEQFERCDKKDLQIVAEQVHFNINIARQAITWLNDILIEGEQAMEQLTLKDEGY
jgi:hypothetical protein